VPYIVFMSLALAGGFWCRDRLGDLIVPCLALGYFLSTSLIFYAEIRQRQYLVPFLALFAGVALLNVVSRIRSAKTR
jgi:hypothetical protein